VRRDRPKVGRNDPCPCGSGKKYKKCHGKDEERRPPNSAQRVAQRRAAIDAPTLRLARRVTIS